MKRALWHLRASKSFQGLKSFRGGKGAWGAPCRRSLILRCIWPRSLKMDLIEKCQPPAYSRDEPYKKIQKGKWYTEIALKTSHCFTCTWMGGNSLFVIELHRICVQVGLSWRRSVRKLKPMLSYSCNEYIRDKPKPFWSASDWTKRIELARSLVMSRSVVKVYHPQINGDVYARHWKSTAHGRKKPVTNLTLTHVAIFGKDWKGICNKCMVARIKGAGARESKHFNALAVFGIFGQCDLWQTVTLQGLDLLQPGQQVYTLKLGRLKGDEAWSHHFVQLFRLHHIPLTSP